MHSIRARVNCNSIERKQIDKSEVCNKGTACSSKRATGDRRQQQPF